MKSIFAKTMIIAFIAIIIDQVIKVWIKTSFYLGESRNVLGKFFQLSFTENNGMAMGFEFGGDSGKIFLTIFRILASIGIVVFLYLESKKSKDMLKFFVWALILAGAVGNTIDCIFYGQFFTHSAHGVATAFPEQGYAPYFQGMVVDMFYFEFWRIQQADAPSWLPNFLFDARGEWVFFKYIFNFADACISVGIALLIIFNKRFFPK